MTVKEQLKAVVEDLPENCTIEDMQYRLYVLEKIRLAEESSRKHGTISQEEAVQRLDKWLLK